MSQFVGPPLGLMAAPPTVPGKVAPTEATAPDTTYAWAVDYIEDAGVLQLPIAGPEGAPALVVKTSATFGTKVITWLAERIGAPPVLPSRQPQDPANEVYKGQTLTNGILALAADGVTPIYRRGGSYYYALRNPVNLATTGLKGAKPPWAPGLGDNTIRSGDFQNLY